MDMISGRDFQNKSFQDEHDCGIPGSDFCSGIGGVTGTKKREHTRQPKTDS